jgi:predicted nucleic acid-binding protein
MIVLDTNVVSELMRANPAEVVVKWVGRQPAASLFTTTITQAEILFGLAVLPTGKRRAALESCAEQMFAEDFGGRILPFDAAAAHEFARIAATRRARGHPIAHADAQIAAIARSHGASVATRNVSDFEHCRVSIVDPWRVQH